MFVILCFANQVKNSFATCLTSIFFAVTMNLCEQNIEKTLSNAFDAEKSVCKLKKNVMSAGLCLPDWKKPQTQRQKSNLERLTVQ